MGFHKNTCTDKGNFGFDLMHMGKQNIPYLSQGGKPMSDLENKIVGRHKRKWYNATQLPPLMNDVFVFDIAQLSSSEDNQNRSEVFREDVKQFLGLGEEALPPLVHNKPGKKLNATMQAIKDQKKINICDSEYKPVREELMKLSRMNSQWIRDVFLELPTVYSSKIQLKQILEGWMDDPCEQEGVTKIK